MKILQMNPAFYPAMAYGGTVALAYQLSKELVTRGHEVTVYTSDSLDKYSRQKEKFVDMNGIQVYYFRNLSNTFAWHRLVVTPGMLPRLSKETRNFNIIHLHGSRNFQNIIAHHYAKKHGIPYILQAHGSVIVDIPKQRLKQLYDFLWGYKVLRDASKVIAVTPTEAEQYRSMGVDEHRIEIVPNGIDLAEYDSLPQKGEFRRKYSITENEKIILYLGRIHQSKGIDLLARAFADLNEHMDKAKLVIVGADDGHLPALRELIRELGIEQGILLTGPLYGREKLAAYVDADVFVNPRTDEIFGLVFLEALACSTPVICSKGCGIADVIDGQAGLAVPNDKDQLGRAILCILDNEGIRQEFRERGKSLVRERFDWRKIVEQVEKTYADCLSQ